MATFASRAPVVVHLRNSRISRMEKVLLDVLARRPGPLRFIAVSNGAAQVAGASIARAATVIGDPVAQIASRGLRPPHDPPRIG
ncbi:MAG: hypothetical protein KDA37_18465, partial [Planctomycetales bacterium]|nr:hypothetical protein [Planctomycetales bacterium]